MNVHNQKLYEQANLQLCNSEFKMYHKQRIREKKKYKERLKIKWKTQRSKALKIF